MDSSDPMKDDVKLQNNYSQNGDLHDILYPRTA